MFKLFFSTRIKPGDDPTFDRLILEASLGLNGDDLFNILPLEVQEELERLLVEDMEVNDFFSKSNIIYLVAQKIKDITGLSVEERKDELKEVTDTNFFK